MKIKEVMGKTLILTKMRNNYQQIWEFSWPHSIGRVKLNISIKKIMKTDWRIYKKCPTTPTPSENVKKQDLKGWATATKYYFGLYVITGSWGSCVLNGMCGNRCQRPWSLSHASLGVQRCLGIHSWSAQIHSDRPQTGSRLLWSQLARCSVTFESVDKARQKQ